MHRPLQRVRRLTATAAGPEVPSHACHRAPSPHTEQLVLFVSPAGPRRSDVLAALERDYWRQRSQDSGPEGAA
jgi:hypothetical protein